jgi:hypothetical protein
LVLLVVALFYPRAEKKIKRAAQNVIFFVAGHGICLTRVHGRGWLAWGESLDHLPRDADPPRVSPRADQIVPEPGFFKELVPKFRARWPLASWDADPCWRERERIGAEGVGSPPCPTSGG